MRFVLVIAVLFIFFCLYRRVNRISMVLEEIKETLNEIEMPDETLCAASNIHDDMWTWDANNGGSCRKVWANGSPYEKKELLEALEMTEEELKEFIKDCGWPDWEMDPKVDSRNCRFCPFICNESERNICDAMGDDTSAQDGSVGIS